MQIIPIKTPVLRKGDDLVSLIQKDIQDSDILIVSSKAIATIEGAAIDLSTIAPSQAANDLATSRGDSKPPEFFEVVLKETARMNGSIVQANYGVALTELKPEGMEGSFLVPNAGLDTSNIEAGFTVGWPVDPVASVKALNDALGNVALILTDSGLSPRRRGVTAFAIACSGIDPLLSLIDTPDLFGNNLHVTEEAVADQLATAGNAIMGNSDQCIPAAIIRDHHYTLSTYLGYVPGIEREKDLYHNVI